PPRGRGRGSTRPSGGYGSPKRSRGSRSSRRLSAVTGAAEAAAQRVGEPRGPGRMHGAEPAGGKADPPAAERALEGFEPGLPGAPSQVETHAAPRLGPLGGPPVHVGDGALRARAGPGAAPPGEDFVCVIEEEDRGGQAPLVACREETRRRFRPRIAPGRGEQAARDLERDRAGAGPPAALTQVEGVGLFERLRLLATLEPQRPGTAQVVAQA